MKKITLFIIVSLLTTLTYGQTWNLELATEPSLARDFALFADDDGYLYHRTGTSEDFFRIDEYGTIMNVYNHNLPQSYFSSATKILKNNQDYIISTSPSRVYKMDDAGTNIGIFDAPNNLSLPQVVTKRLSSFVVYNNQIYFSSSDSLYLLNIGNLTANSSYSLGGNYTTVSMQNDGSDVILLVQGTNSQYHILVFTFDGILKATYNTSFIAQDFIVSNDGYVIVGSDNGNAAIEVIDRNGGQVWSQTYGTGVFYSIVQDGNNYIASGSNNNVTSGQTMHDAMLTKVDESGTLNWSKLFLNTIQNGSRTRLIKTNQNNGYVFATTTHLIKTDLNGNTAIKSDLLYANGSAIINGNNIQTIVNPDGGLFWDYDNGLFRFPADSLTSTIFASGLWMGGFDQGGNIKVAAQTYAVNGSDYVPGYIGAWNGAMRKVWKITKDQINQIRRDFDDNNVIDNTIPFDILTYPAHGNPNVYIINGGFVPIPVDYLPYVDRNQDGIYNVYDGDYPIIKGDMQLTWMMNDAGLHYQSTGFPLQFDIVGMLYANECNGDGLVDNTLFLNFKCINRGLETIDSLHLGMWTDFDLGCHTDDYIGSMPATNSFFAYNQTGIDGQNGCNVPTFGVDIPIQSVTYLNTNMDYFIQYQNGPNGAGGNPQTALEYYNLISGKWSDGSPITYGGNGYNSSTTPTNHVFSGNPSDLNDWSMVSENIIPADFRTIASSNFSSLAPGGILEFEMAYITHENVPHPAPDVTPIGQRITQVQNYYDNEDLNWNIYLGANPNLTVGQTLTLTANIEGGNSNATYTYLWPNGATTQSIDAIAPIAYSVTVTNNITGCSKTDEVQVTFATSTELVANEMDKIAIFPNPTQDIVTIDITALDNENLTVQLIDVTGRTIKSVQNENSDIIRFDVSNVAQGVYFVTFLNDNFEKIGTKKVVILD